ncbi:AsmA family protein [bacterium A37T11]|nr:AsmA family protein [bacterium A37T11]
MGNRLGEAFKKIKPKTLKIAAFVLGGFLLVLLIAGIILLNKRDSLLGRAIEKAKAKTLATYDIKLELKKAHFSGLTTVALEGLQLLPENRPRLMTIKNLEVSVRLFPLIFGEIKLESLDIHEAAITLVKKDSTSNYDFLFRQKKTDSTDAKEKVDLSDLANRMLNNVLYKIPENMTMRNFSISYQDDSLHHVISIPKADIDDGDLTSTIYLNKKEAVWHATGELYPGKKQLYLRFFAEGKPVEFPLLERKYGLKLQFDTIETHLKNVFWNDQDELQISGSWAIKNLKVHHWRIANNDVGVANAEANAEVVVGKNYIGLDKTSEFRTKKLILHPYAKYTLSPVKTYAFGISTPKLEAQDIFDSFPTGLFESLEGIRVGGTLQYTLDFYLDDSQPDSVKFESTLKPEHFRINAWGKTNFSRINQPFVYTPYEYGKPMRNITVGPDNPNFTPLDQISPYLKNALMTAEDPSFFSHHGFVEESIRSSIATNYKAKAFRRGGSTISMQLVKNVFLARDKTLARKVEEILIVWLIENNKVISKNRMLEVYLNIIEWGRNVYGIGEASRYYFGKHPSELDLGESIYLASIVPRPKGGLYPFQYDGSLKPYLSGYFRLIGSLMARRGWAPVDTSRSYGFYGVRLKESLRPAPPANIDSLQTPPDSVSFFEKEIEEARGLLEKIFGKKKKEDGK